jgi:hypothetical protein
MPQKLKNIIKLYKKVYMIYIPKKYIDKMLKVIDNKLKEFCMISVKESIEKIKREFLDLFGPDVTDIRLEEINESNSNEYYLTVSFLVPNKNMSSMVTSTLGSIVNPYIREYKNVVVNKENGNIISIKIHKDA